MEGGEEQQGQQEGGQQNEGIEMQPEKKSFGPMFGIIIIVILLLLAGFYFWGNSLESLDETAPTGDDVMMEEPLTEEEAMEEVGGAVSESDELDALEEELSATDLEGLDTEFSDIDLELQ